MSIRQVLVATASAAALGLGLVPASAAPVAAPVTGAASAATSVADCASADLVARFRVTGVAAGSTYGRLRLRNVSDRVCRIRGYGGVSYVGFGDGTQIGHAAVRERRRSVRSRLLRPGQSVQSRLQMSNAGNYPKRRCRPAPVDGFRVYVPDAWVSKYVPYETTGCRNRHVRLLHQRPYRKVPDRRG